MVPTCMGLRADGHVQLAPTDAATLTRTAEGNLAVWQSDRVLTVPMAGGAVREVPLTPGPPCAGSDCEVQVRALAGENCRRVPPGAFVDLVTDDGVLVWRRGLARDWAQAMAAPDGHGNCGLVARNQANLRVVGIDGHKDIKLPPSAEDPHAGRTWKIEWLRAAADLHGGWWVAGQTGQFGGWVGLRSVVGHVAADGTTALLLRQPKGAFGVVHLDLEANPRGAWLVAITQGSAETEQGVAEFVVHGSDGIEQAGSFVLWSDASPGGGSHWGRTKRVAVRQPMLDRLGLLHASTAGSQVSASRSVDRVLLPEAGESRQLDSWLWPPAELYAFYTHADNVKHDRAPCGWPDHFWLPQVQAVDLPGGGLAMLVRTPPDESIPGVSNPKPGQLVLFRLSPTGPCAGTCGDGACRVDEQEWCWGDCPARAAARP